MHIEKNKIAVIAGCLALGATAQASIVGLVNTGANTDSVDTNWKVDGQNAYVAQDNGSFPFNGYWINNDSTSKWITYSTPLNTAPASTQEYNYQLTFTANGSSQFLVRWLSDNGSQMYLDGTLIGTRDFGVDSAAAYGQWNTWQEVSVTGGTHTLTFDVQNYGSTGQNPTGLRAEFAAVPETSTFFAGTLLLLPFGVSALRSVRRNRE